MNVLKIDLDIQVKEEAINQIASRLYFLNKIEMLKYSRIKKVELVKKTKYSCKIYLNSNFKDVRDLIIIQSILGDDYKRTAITFRDFLYGFENFNRLFDCKRYPDGEYKFAEFEDITDSVVITNE